MLSLSPVPPIAAPQLLIFLLQVGLLLLLAMAFGRLATRLGMPAVVGELFVGVLLGPSVLANLAPGVAEWLFPTQGDQFHLLDAFGQIGVLLLVGITGIHMDLRLVRRRGVAAANVSAGGLVIPLALGVWIGFLLPASLMAERTDRTVFALFMGVAMCVSAIPVIAKTLMDMRLLHRNVGQLTLTAGMLDDAFGWLMLSVVSAMATSGVRGGQVALSLVHLVGVVFFALTIGRPLVRGAFRLTSRTDDPGPSVAMGVVIVLLGAATTHALGLEAVFGAFVCGILIGSASGLDLSRLAPLRTVVLSVFAPVFFAMAGLRMDFTSLAEPGVLLAGLVVLLIAILGKFAGAYLGARLSSIKHWEALALGAGLNARGVIEVIVAMVGLRLGILSVEAYTIIVLVAIVTSVMAPPILRWTMKRVMQTAEESLREYEHATWDVAQPRRSAEHDVVGPDRDPAEGAPRRGPDGGDDRGSG